MTVLSRDGTRRGQVSALVRFSYDDVDKRTGQDLKRTAARIRKLSASLVADTMAIGKHLWRVKARLTANEGQQFWDWVRAEFDWSASVAFNFMQVAEKFGHWPDERLFRFQQSALYFLARNKAPRQAVEEAVNRADAGEAITKQVALRLLRQHAMPRERKRMTTQERIRKLRFFLRDFVRAWPDEDTRSIERCLRDFAAKLKRCDGGDSFDFSTLQPQKDNHDDHSDENQPRESGEEKRLEENGAVA